MHIQAGTNSNRSQQCDIHNDIWGNTLLFLLAEGTNESWLHPLLLWNRARDCSMQRTADLRWFCCYLINKIHYQQRQKRGTSNNLHFSFGLCLLSPYSQPLPPIVSCGAEIAVQAHLFPRRQPRPRLDPSGHLITEGWKFAAPQLSNFLVLRNATVFQTAFSSRRKDPENRPPATGPLWQVASAPQSNCQIKQTLDDWAEAAEVSNHSDSSGSKINISAAPVLQGWALLAKSWGQQCHRKGHPTTTVTASNSLRVLSNPNKEELAFKTPHFTFLKAHSLRPKFKSLRSPWPNIFALPWQKVRASQPSDRRKFRIKSQKKEDADARKGRESRDSLCFSNDLRLRRVEK